MDASEELPPLEAALLMGITPELLFAYTRYPPKKFLDLDKKLQIHHVQGHTHFRRSELLAFDSYLREPWAAAADERPSVPRYVADYLKVECGGQCARCSSGFPLENAHIQAYAETRSHHHHNLIRLCATCHGQFDAGIVSPGDLQTSKDTLVSKLRERIEFSRACEILPARSLPVPTNRLVGRADELSALERALAVHRVVAVFGPGGCGKTELLLHALARGADSRQVLWIEVGNEIGPRDLEIILQSAVPRSATGQLSSVAAQLDAFGGYVVFDGVEQGSRSDFETVVCALIAGTTRARFVFTSQLRFLDLPIEKALDLTPLLPADSRTLLCANWQMAPSREEELALEWIESFAEGHPLTLRLTNALLRFYERAAIVAERIRKHGASAVAHPVRAHPARATSLERCLRTAYAGLSMPAKRVMYAASHCPAGFFENMLVDGPIGIEGGQVAIAGLRQWHLLQVMWDSGDTRRLRALAPVRAFFRDAFASEWSDDATHILHAVVQAIAFHSVVMDHQYFSAGKIALGMERFDAELPNLLHALDQAKDLSADQPRYFEAVRQIAASLQVFCFIAGASRQAVAVMRLGVEAAIQTGKHASAAGMSMHLLVQAERLGDEAASSEAIGALRDLASRTSSPEVAAHRALAEAMLALRDHRAEESLHWATVAGDLLEPALDAATDKDAELEEAATLESFSMALMAKGRALEALSESRLAIASYERALEAMSRCGDAINPGAVMHQLGNCHARERDSAKAFDCYVDATLRFAEMGVAEHIGNSLSELGYLLLGYEAGMEKLSVLTGEMLDFGAADVLDSTRRAYLEKPSTLWVARCTVALRRLLGFCMVASLSRHEVKVVALCELVRQEIVLPLSSGLRGRDVELRHPVRDESVFLMLLDVSMAAAANLCQVIGDDNTRPSLQVVGVAASQCFQMPPQVSSHYRLPQWLTVYLRCCHNISGLTERDLANSVKNSQQTSQPFVLSGFAEKFS